MAKTAVDPFDTVGTPAHNAPVLEELTFAQLMEQGVIEVSEIDDTEQVDKADLVNVAMIIFDWTFKTSETGDYVIVRAKTQDGTIVFADGSTGIKDQLLKYQTRLEKAREEGTQWSGLYVPRGLRYSDYTYTDPNTGDKSPARTYYIDNRKK